MMTSRRKRRIRKNFGRRRKCPHASRIAAPRYPIPYRFFLYASLPSNQRAPMPQLVMAGSHTGAAATSPPPAAFQPALRILKRPTASPSSSSSASSLPTSGNGSSNSSSDTYAEREARYQAARDRIFGDSSPSLGRPNEQSQPKTQSSAPKPSPPQVQIAREPRGPPAADPDAASPDGKGQGGESRGFGSRRGKRRGAGKT